MDERIRVLARTSSELCTLKLKLKLKADRPVIYIELVLEERVGSRYQMT